VAPVTLTSSPSPAAALTCRIAALLLPLLFGCHVDQTGIGAEAPPPAPARPDARLDRTPPPVTEPEPVEDAGPTPVAEPAPAADAGPADSPGADLPAAPADGGGSGTASVDGGGALDTGGTAPAPPCETGPNLALCLRFEGSLADQSGNELQVRTAGPVRYGAAPEGQALELRPGQQLTIAETPLLDSPVVTVAVTVRPRTLGRRMGIVENAGQYALVILPSGSAMCTGAGGYALTNNAVAPERWTRLRCVYDGTRTMLFIDGRQTATNPSGPLATNRAEGLRIGWEVLPDRHFDGQLADLRIWRGVHQP
jgi:hypothetical protein